MTDSDPPPPRVPRPPPLTALEHLTFSEQYTYGGGRLRTGNYDYPDGEQCFSKIAKSVRLATILGSAVSLFDLSVVNQPRSPAMLASRYLFTVVPAASAAAVFASTNCVMGSIRGKDDCYNHAVGGCLGGAMLAVGTGKIILGVGGCVAGGFLGVVTKTLMLNDFDITRSQTYRINGMLGHEDRYWGSRSTKPGAFTSIAKEPTDY